MHTFSAVSDADEATADDQVDGENSSVVALLDPLAGTMAKTRCRAQRVPEPARLPTEQIEMKKLIILWRCKLCVVILKKEGGDLNSRDQKERPCRSDVSDGGVWDVE